MEHTGNQQFKNNPHIYTYVSALAGLTAGPNGLPFFEETLEKKIQIFNKTEFFLCF